MTDYVNDKCFHSAKRPPIQEMGENNKTRSKHWGARERRVLKNLLRMLITTCKQDPVFLVMSRNEYARDEYSKTEKPEISGIIHGFAGRIRTVSAPLKGNYLAGKPSQYEG